MASSTIPTFALIISLVFISWDSPRFLMKHDAFMYRQYLKKRKSWRRRFEDIHQNDGIVPRAREDRSGTEERAVAVPPNRVHMPSLPRRIFDAVRFLYGPHPDFGYSSKAFNTLTSLRNSELLAAKEMVFTHCQLVIHQLAAENVVNNTEDIDLSIRSLSWGQRLKDLFKRHTYLSRELTAASVIMIAQQLCG